MSYLKYFIIGGIVFLLLFIIVLFIIISKKKMGKIDFKIEDALDSINEYLENKISLMKESKDICKDKNYLNNFEDEDFNRDNFIELNDFLNELEAKFNDLLLEDEDLAKDEKVIEYVNRLKENDINLKASINYYNDKVNEYLELKYTFPINCVKLFCGFKKYILFNVNEKKD